ncbi:hypothetical protein GCM10025777_03170 [Membranihabitans marinus]
MTLSISVNSQSIQWENSLDTVIEIGHQKQLFIDDYIIETSKGIEFTMHQPYMTGETLLESDQPYEKGGFPYLYSSVIKDDNMGVQLWYDFFKPKSSDPYDHDRHLAYAISKDGIHFEKPNLGFYEYNGNKDNNIVIPGVIGGGSVWIDPKAEAEHRYKSQSKVYPSGEFHMHSSPDGIHWKKYGKINPQGPHDTQTIVFWDDTLKKYLFYGRYFIQRGDIRERAVRRAIIKDDFKTIENTGLAIWSDLKDKNKYSDIMSHGNTVDYYGATVFKYEGVYLMLAQAYWHWVPNTTFQGTDEPGMRDVRLAVSRNSVDFKRLGERKAFMTPGPMGRFDSKQLWALPNPIVMGDEIWIYYSGVNWDRAGRIDPMSEGKKAAIGRAVLRLDGWVSADASYENTGEIITKPIQFSGTELKINANTGAGGSIRLAILDEEGQVIEGFDIEDCHYIIGNSTQHKVEWDKHPKLLALKGQTIRLKFVLRDCELYSFQFL